MKSSFARERLVDDKRFAGLLEGGWGWIEITSLQLEGGQDLADRIGFIAPDDGNRDDCTVARVALSRPVAPGDRLRFTIEFHARVPRGGSLRVGPGFSREAARAQSYAPRATGALDRLC